MKEVILSDSNIESLLTLGSNGSSPLFSDCALDSIYIGRNISYKTDSGYGYSPFYRNTSLRSVVITDKEEEISDNEFYGCTNLQRVVIGDGVTKIGDWAFSGCQSLKHFAFGTQVQTIGKEAFSDCTSVLEISSKAATPPVCGSQALDDINKWECQLFVPTGALTTYQEADQWKEFFFTQEGEGRGESPVTPVSEKCATPTISLQDGKLKFTCATEGVEYHYSISNTNIGSGVGNDVDFSQSFTISVYAIKYGCDNSDVARKVIDAGSGLIGDVNGDGRVDIVDVTTTIDIILGKGE